MPGSGSEVAIEAHGDANGDSGAAAEAPGSLEELIFLGTGTSGSVPATHCLIRRPVLCRVCFEASCYTVVDEVSGDVVATGSLVPGMGGQEISAMLVGPAYFRAVMAGHAAEPDPDAAGTNPINGLLRPANDVFPDRLPAAGEEEPAPAPLGDYPDTADRPVTSLPHRRHILTWNKNRRRNTSAALRVRLPSGEERTVVIDCGKSFYEASLEHFPKHGLRRIDALVLTHGHADACFGLDDLRQWTIGPKEYRTQDAIDVYLNEETLDVVAGAFPYLVDKKRATGGGDVTSLRFHTITSSPPTPFLAAGLPLLPFPVEHGVLHSTPSGAGTPYVSLGFRAGPLAYISDISRMTEEAWGACRGAKVMVLDSLRDDPHPSHFGIGQAVEVALEIRPRLCLLVGWSHFMEHEEICAKLAAHEGLREAGVVMRAAYDGESVRMADWA
ncbi:beta-lactamase-like protein [Hyaloraphidium curvatum]|nr:beta-lactamase-like protein [Hyaloraphidium curvatum]